MNNRVTRCLLNHMYSYNMKKKNNILTPFFIKNIFKKYLKNYSNTVNTTDNNTCVYQLFMFQIISFMW